MSRNMKEMRDNLMHSNGTSAYETASVIIPNFVYTSFTTVLVTIISRNYTLKPWQQFLIEFTSLIIPSVLNVTILNQYSIEIACSCVTLLFTTLLIGQSSIKSKDNDNSIPVKSAQDFITNARSTINLLSVVAILAVDFQVFPRRFAKTETFGFSLMDVGVGLFVYANGIVDGLKNDVKSSLKGAFPLIILGLGRFLLTREIDYHVPLSEYGVHWNFFITLASIKIFVALLLLSVDIKYIYINATILLISHEFLLQSFLQNLVMTQTKRTSFVLANKEGLVSCLGYVVIYLYSAYFGYFMDFKKSSNQLKVRTLIKFGLSSVIALVLTIFLSYHFGVSRKLANAAYCFWVLFIGVSMTGLFYLGEIIQNNYFGTIKCSPLIYQAINYNGLAFFLVSNVFTGLINIICDTLAIQTIPSLIIILTYMFVNCGLVYILYRRQIKVKLL